MLSAALPAPDAEARRHSAKLVTRLQAEIRRRGWLAFDDFMRAALYAPGLGYYRAGLPKFAGPECGGDFVTAAGLGDVTARCLARQCAEVLAAVGGGDILEVGGGDGRMAADLLAELAHLGALPGNYCILETAAELRARQGRALRRLPAELRGRARWLDALPGAREFTGVMVAVEALDAMPVARFEIDADGRALALGVALDGDRHSDSGAGGGDSGDAGAGNGDGDAAFRWSTSAPLPAALQRRICADGDGGGDSDGNGELPPGYRSEINLHAEAWTRAAGAALRRGALLVVDYGFPRREFYHPQRRDGTLMCHYRHLAHADPFFYPGLQDITAHVDFTAIADAARAAGLGLAGYASQGAFLLSLGALELATGDAPLRHPRSPRLKDCGGDGAGSGGRDGERDARARLTDCGRDGEWMFRAQELGRLTLPHEMGELFKVAAFTRGYDRPLTGFALKNRRASI